VSGGLIQPETFDAVCIGGGAIGLMIAHDLVQEGLRVAVVDRAATGREASWAGAGIVPPAHDSAAHSPYDRLRAVSYRRFAELSKQIASDVGVDIGYRPCGALEAYPASIDLHELSSLRQQRAAAGIEFHTLSPEQTDKRLPGLRGELVDWIPGVCQIRNPRFLRGLQQWLRHRGVTFFENDAARDVRWSSRSRTKVDAVLLASGAVLSCGHAVLGAGAWSGELLRQWTGIELPIYPVQGEILVLDASSDPLPHILLAGKRYIVPRGDRLILVGSTEEEIGFDKRVTAQAMIELRQFAGSLLPRLASLVAVHMWAGLRPANRLGHPVLGRASQAENLWVATGHFRHGVQQSPGTARLMADWILGRDSFASASDFSIDQPATLFQSPFQS
jgi:glycine oxidase